MCLVIMMISFPLYADVSGEKRETPYAFSMAIQGGFLWGQGEEIVYSGNNYRNNSPYVSQLLWDYKPLVLAGLYLDYGPRYPWITKGLYTSLSFKYGLPLGTGIMENRDWLAMGSDELSNYSQHDAFSRSSLDELFEGYGSFTANLLFGYSFALINRLWIKPYGELSFMRFSWAARDGYWQYGEYLYGDYYKPIDSKSPINFHYGPIINYSQNWFIIAAGIEAGVNINDHLLFSIFAGITPLIFGAHRDDHLHVTKTNTYLDYLFGGLYINAGITLEYYFNRKIALALSAVYMNLDGSRGDTHISEFGGPYIIHQGSGGGGFSFMDFALRLRYIF